jgi:pyruvate formate lyase activating enzyme
MCRHDAIALTDRGSETDRERCEACGDCVEACPADARALAGRTITVAELVAAIEKDRVFLDRSGGGVTFSGGEPLMQPDFLGAAIAACRAAGWHTAVETSGYGTPEAMAVAATADLVLFDLKIHDAAEHRRLTGVSNRLILKNFAQVAARHSDVRVRLPLVPGLTDGWDNIEAIGRLAASAGVRRVDLLPYHTAGRAKYERLGRLYALADTAPPSPDAIDGTRRQLERLGLAVQTGG